VFLSRFRPPNEPSPVTALWRLSPAHLIASSFASDICFFWHFPSISILAFAFGDHVSMQNCICIIKAQEKIESKVITVTGRGGLQGCEILKIPHCLDSRLTDGCKVVSPSHRPRSTPRYICLFLVLISIRG
jgi:hypothetical protein